MAETLRLIKKYPNRRLYDTKMSCYITLADVKQLVIKQECFQVVDAKTGDDLTRSILLQIILEEESGGSPMFTHDVLTQFIRFYGNAMQGFMGEYLQRNLHAFIDFQKTMQASSDAADPGKPSPEMWAQFMTYQAPAVQNLMSAYMEHSKTMLEQMQQQFQAQSQNFLASFQFPGFGTPPQSGANGAKTEQNAQPETPNKEPGH
ncbi:MAG TPA: polyhydroxyalkanoate synthesis repressor PhaR [Burkholderiales bacterium]